MAKFSEMGKIKDFAKFLCNQERIEGVIRIGSTWGIPDTAEKPKDARIKSGKYIKAKDA